jgi:sortase A
MDTPKTIRLEFDDRGLTPSRRAGRSRRTRLRWLERLLILVGVVCVGYFVYTYAEASLYQAFEDRELDKILNQAAVRGTSGTTSEDVDAASKAVPRRIFAPGSTVGRIEIPRLGVSAVIRAGTDARTLRLAVGYIPGTALPGDPGNFGLAGHRDTFFRKLRDINPDDEIRIVTTDGVFRYDVQRTSIVMPEDVWVLDPTNYPALTLVTCYPFNYVGSAPKRFIVRAALQTTEVPARSTVVKPPAAKRASTKPTVSKAPRTKAKAVRAKSIARSTNSIARPTRTHRVRPTRLRATN